MATAHLRVVSAHHEEHETPKQQPKNEKTKVPGVYRRGNRYVYCYRVEGRQRRCC
jgi:ribosomal protein S30